VHLFERECSIQRRHQKIIEETPSPALDDDLRSRMGEAAVAAARAVGYQGAGTVEFLLDANRDFFFLEMNTRLQVEHPITELVTGVDLVRAQIHVAEGRPLPWTQEGLTARGHAIECRICAEDPANGFLPSLGGILLMHEPVGPGVRLDSGVRAGDEVSMHYDPLLAKLCVVAEDRPAAIERMLRALDEFAILGVATNVGYLADVLRDEVFASGDLDTGFLAERFAGWNGSGAGDGDLALAVAAIAEAAGRTPGSAADPGASRTPHATPWNTLGRFRLHGLD
jgi:acetyl/propionyl-CoA carboxylase alpha subunit